MNFCSRYFSTSSTNIGISCLAGPAPGRPEVDEQRTALEIGQLHVGAVHVLERKVEAGALGRVGGRRLVGRARRGGAEPCQQRQQHPPSRPHRLPIKHAHRLSRLHITTLVGSRLPRRSAPVPPECRLAERPHSRAVSSAGRGVGAGPPSVSGSRAGARSLLGWASSLRRPHPARRTVISGCCRAAGVRFVARSRLASFGCFEVTLCGCAFRARFP